MNWSFDNGKLNFEIGSPLLHFLMATSIISNVYHKHIVTDRKQLVQSFSHKIGWWTKTFSQPAKSTMNLNKFISGSSLILSKGCTHKSLDEIVKNFIPLPATISLTAYAKCTDSIYYTVKYKIYYILMLSKCHQSCDRG